MSKSSRKIMPIKAKKAVLLTGTPITNRPKELWTLVKFVDPNGIGKNFFKFAKRYCGAYRDVYGWNFDGATNLDELNDRLREACMVRRLKSEVLPELPDKIRQIIEIPANGASAIIAKENAAYQAYEEKIEGLREAVEFSKTSSDEEYSLAVANLRDAIDAAFTEIAAIRHETALAKVPYVIDHLKDALESGPVIVFAHHRDVVAKLKEAFPDASVVIGGMSANAVQTEVDRFQNGDSNLFIGNIKAAGVGLTLTRSSHVIFAELDFVPANMNQAEDRAHRIGQKNSVLVQHLVLENSLDARMAKILIGKQSIIDKALDQGGSLKNYVDVVSPTVIDLETPEKTFGQFEAEASKLSTEQIEAIHTALKILSKNCDGASSEDGMGFNKLDTQFGKDLAERKFLTGKQALYGQKLVRKYRRQLGENLLRICGC